MICYLIRHGKDDDSVRGGWSLSPLTDEGVRQAEELADYVETKREQLKIEAVYSSDLPRAMQTAEPMAQRLNLAVSPMPRFREVNNGKLAGMKNDLAAELYPGMYWNCMGWEERYPDGESPKIFFDRISAAWSSFQGEITARNENVVLVTHSGVINVILSIINQRPYSNAEKTRRIQNADIIAIEYADGEWSEVWGE